MSTLVVYAATTDGHIESYGGEGSAYLDVRAGGTLTASTAGTGLLFGDRGFDEVEGNPLSYWVWESFIQFDTSSIGSGSTVSAAVLTLSPINIYNASVQARLRDWGTALTIEDWVAGASLSGLTLLAHGAFLFSMAAIDLTDDAFPANVNKVGPTRLLLCDPDTIAGGDPGLSDS